MPITDVRVTLRVASSDFLRPRAWQGSAVSIEATITDQDDAPVPSAAAYLSWVAPDGIEARSEALLSNDAGIVTGLLAIPGTGSYVARCRVTAPVLRIVQRPFDMIAGAVSLDAETAVPLVTPDGVFLVLSNGGVIGGVL